MPNEVVLVQSEPPGIVPMAINAKLIKVAEEVQRQTTAELLDLTLEHLGRVFSEYA